MNSKTIGRSSKSLFVALGLLLGTWQAQANPLSVSAVVGEITTVIGQSNVIGSTGAQAAVRGQPIRVGDRIETTAGGHVHIRFLDGGLISVRPLSRLVVEDYRNADQNSLASIKFKLEDGVMRSVTGQWGEAHRDRFRLNTPIAAIGVKGTDFLVKAQGEGTYASVNTGAIVMAPLAGACAQTLGPCSGQGAIMLSADMHNTMLEYKLQGEGAVPRLVPLVDLLASSANTKVHASPHQANPSPTDDPSAQVRPADALISLKLQDGIDGGAPLPAVQVQLPGTTDAPPASQPLAWFHNSAQWNVPANTISERFDQARLAGRSPVIGNFFITLYRDETVQKTYTPQSGRVAFRLADVSANFNPSKSQGGALEPVAVDNARLQVNFDQSTLATSMDLSSPSLGQSNFAATASVDSNGKFVNQTAGQSIAGALSTDGSQAGFMFDKTVKGGSVSGLTLWGR